MFVILAAYGFFDEFKTLSGVYMGGYCTCDMLIKYQTWAE